MKFSITPVLLACLAVPLCGMISACLSTELDFNGLQQGEQVLSYYDGGFGSLGTGPGPNLGVTFTSDFVTVAGGVVFPTPNDLKSEKLTSASGVMNVISGYSGIFSFYYMASQESNIAWYSNLNGEGTLLGVSPLGPANIWTPGGGLSTLPFESVVFHGNGLAVDNVTFGAAVVPEPASWILALMGLACLVLYTSRARRLPGDSGLGSSMRRSLSQAHVAHHPKAIEIHRGKPILYGCGDFISDDEGTSGRMNP